MLKILLTGCNGRMGNAVTKVCEEQENLTIAAGVDISLTELKNYPRYNSIHKVNETADVIIDFSNPMLLEDLLRYACEHGLPVVLATTGYSEEQVQLIQQASQKIPIFRSGNMSLGISVLSELVNRAAKVLGEGYDVEIIEKHHNQKLDAPSGTALMLYDAANRALPYEATACYERQSRREKRNPHEIGIHSIRGGTIVGEHEVIFAGYQEVLSLSHSCFSREVFATGAVKAALFLSEKEPGMYNMTDLVQEILK